MRKKIFIASDHAGYDLKTKILGLKNDNFIDLGTHSSDSVDYPDYSRALTDKVVLDKNSLGILICGSGIGMNMAANRHKNIRAALCYNIKTSKLSRMHNNANVLILPGRFINVHKALNCVDNFLTSDFEYGRHQARVDKLK